MGEGVNGYIFSAIPILRIITDAELRSRMIEKGFEQVKTFTLEKTAQQMLEIYRMIVKL